MTRQVSLLLLALLPLFCTGQLSIVVQVEREGVRGSVRLAQEDEDSHVAVSLNLSGNVSQNVQLSIHSLPFPPSSPDPCQLVGPVVSELGTVSPQSSVNYTNISLYGRESIVGRSLLIKSINSLSVCANIRPATNPNVLWAPFRANNGTNGNVFLWQQTIYVSLETETEETSSELQWAILSPMSECHIAPGNIYDPTNMVGEGCNTTGCVVGDVGGRNGALMVDRGSVRAVFNDPELDVGGVEGLVLAVGGQCAAIQTFHPLRVVGGAGEGGVALTQSSPLDTTEVAITGSLDLTLEIHSGPDCLSTGGIFDPRGAGHSSNNGATLDLFPFGDISGKSGGQAVYSDPYLPLTGSDSVVGRTLLVKRTDGSISGCGLLRYYDDVIQMRASLEMEGFSGNVVFSQIANDPFSPTIITVITNITAEIDIFTPSSTSFEATPTTTPLITTRTDVLTPSLTPSLSPSLTPSLSPSPSLLLPYETSSGQQFPLPSSSSVLLLAPDITDTFTPAPSVTPDQQGRRRRRRRREAGSIGVYYWSLRQLTGSMPEDCSQLPVVGSSSESCSSSTPLSCASGDLTTKHGSLSSGPLSAVFHDPFLPLSGPHSVGSAVLFLEPANGAGETVCVPVTMVTSRATPTPTPLLSSVLPTSQPGATATATTSSGVVSSSAVVPTFPPTRQQTGDDNNIILIGAIVGGVVGGALVLTAAVLCVCLCVRRLRSRQFDLSKQKSNGGDLELGHYLRKPQIGSDNYRVIFSYHPNTSDSGDLALEEGEWVTLLEAPAGGQWWRGQTAAGKGWFPKSNVRYVDREAERKKAEEENFNLAAAAIKAASNSFNEHHHSLAATKNKATPTSSRRAKTFSRADVNSTPVLTAKFSTSTLDSIVIENQRHVSSSSGGSRPHTPRSLQEGEPLANLTNHVSAGNSQGSSGSSELAAMNLESYLVKYNYSGGTEIELPLRKGDLVSVLEKREGGWWQGVCGGRVGWFPASYIKPAPVREPQEGGGEQTKEGGGGEGLLGMEESLKSDTVEATEYRAIHTFASGQEGDLQFTEGDTVLVYWVQDSGWWYGSCGSHHGWFPGTYVELSMSEAGSPLPPSTEDKPAGSGEGEEKERGVARGSPGRRSWRKTLSFKRSKSQEAAGEGGGTPLLQPAPEVKSEMTPSRPRRKAPPPPTTASSKSGDQPQNTPPPSKSEATPTGNEAIPGNNEATPTTTPRHVAKQHKRRKTSSGLDPSKPRRLPPAPPTSLATPGTPPTESAVPHTSYSKPAAPADLAPPSGGATPIAPPRRKMKRVKRPATRLIPPPPTIPLPPPPSRPSQNTSTTQPATVQPSVTEEPHVVVENVLRAATEGVEKVQPEATKPVSEEGRKSPVKKKEEVKEEERKVLKSPAKTKPPPIKPKPAHLSKMLSDSHVFSAVPRPPVQGSPKPPPPARTSSLHHPVRPHRREPKLLLAAIPDGNTSEDHDGGESQETAEAVRNLRSAPPSHPPPPRPPSAVVESPIHRSNPPSFPPPVRPTASDDTAESAITGSPTRSNSLRARGSQLMRSLRKMVQRSESTKEEGGEADSPTRGKRSKQGEVIQNIEVESPDPGRKTEVQKVGGIPARPPPPRMVKSNSEEGGKQAPTRPPPPKLNKTEATPTSPKTFSTPTSPVNRNEPSSPDHTPSSLPGSGGLSPAHSAGSGPVSRSVSPPPPSSFYRAKEDYAAQSPSELTLGVGDVLVELDRPTPHMFYGMLDDGSTGLFPASAVVAILAPSSPHSKN